jgi:hypothetical protein
MHWYLKIFYTIRFYAPRNIFRIFSYIFNFLIQIWKHIRFFTAPIFFPERPCPRVPLLWPTYMHQIIVSSSHDDISKRGMQCKNFDAWSCIPRACGGVATRSRSMAATRDAILRLAAMADLDLLRGKRFTSRPLIIAIRYVAIGENSSCMLSCVYIER